MAIKTVEYVECDYCIGVRIPKVDFGRGRAEGWGEFSYEDTNGAHRRRDLCPECVQRVRDCLLEHMKVLDAARRTNDA